ncbi:putative nuclease HARBI1 [Pectinophora gossypiella]|uniref:putative nuclease HARBI1 n=1 Tax=Pectinophora gossypiella TaxID=13191 RepID=UPI00214F1650|nr:putative nuclease HARBI1 [Pectinophora gossypiella]XP_049880775.1 putative nuclease HARBI1 [Pectinophora gossypiella]
MFLLLKMARMFLLKCLLEEAHTLDNLELRRQAYEIRSLSLLTRDDNYVSVYRLSKQLIDQLELELLPIIKSTKRRGKGLTTRIKILCTLAFLASGSYQKIIKENVRTYLSQTSASRCINEVVEALNNPNILKKYIRFPQNIQERQILKERFYEKFKIPAVIGCIDGTLVALKRPAEHEERFFCRKNYHARNVQLITDADLNILHVDPTYGGATHDSFIFNHCDVRNHLEALTNAGEEVVLLGDSGYAQRAYIMTPINNAPDNTPEAYYNMLHATARNSVERTIGLLKGRFRCLLVHRVLDYHPDKVAKIVIACCVLHNMCNRAGMEVVNLTEDENLEEAQVVAEAQRRQSRDIPNHDDLNVGRSRRQDLVNRLWRSRRH